ncbi:MAG: helicase-related protein [Gemmatimonadota bacterium]
MHPSRDHHLPLDPAAYHASRGAHGRIIIIAPTRAACETIEAALGTHHDTLLQERYGATLTEWARRGIGFGIVAGTGTGKTLGIRPIAEAILDAPLRYGVVNREREATPETPTWNVVVVTTGIARHWFQADLLTAADTIVVDEIHQTSAELELCLALGKRVGCRFIWLSATVDPATYRNYLGSEEVLETSAFDPRLKAKVRVVTQDVAEFLDERQIRRFIRERRGVAVFVPTRAEVEKIATELGDRWRGLNAAFYHGGEPIRVIKPFLDGQVDKPWLLAMTAAGQSAINVPGLDTVVIYDARYGNVVDRGRNVLHRMYLRPNEILQMAGRVHGRVEQGEVTILSDRDLVFESLRPGPPEFQLAGDAERVALTCAAIGVDASQLDLPVPLDRVAYRRALTVLTERGLVEGGRLTKYGMEVDAIPADRPLGELLVQAPDALVPMAAVSASVDSLHRMTREERELHGALVKGSDHLTAYNLYAEAVNQHGYLGQVYGLARHLFEEGIEDWAERRGVLLKAIEDAALGVASIYRALDLPLPATLPYAGNEIREAWAELIARVMPFDLVIDETTADGQSARVSKRSVAGSWGAVAGSLRYFADRFGTPRAGIEGTTIPFELVRKNAVWGSPTVQVDGRGRRQGLVVRRRLSYFGFELESDQTPIGSGIPRDLLEPARSALADALLAGDTRHPGQGPLTRSLERVREYWRRSGGTLDLATEDSLRSRVRQQLATVTGWQEFLQTPVVLDSDQLIPRETRLRLDRLPTMARLRGDAVAVSYEVERGVGVARLWLKEGQARRLSPEDLPELDRPLRFAVVRDEGDLLAASLAELQDLLAASSGHRREGGGRGRPDDRNQPRGGGGRGGGGERKGSPGGRGGQGPRGRRRGR